jgi:hypothetical protein
LADLLHDLSDRVKVLGSDWTKYSVVGSFILYVFGYLALRFHLTAIGVGTDLSVLDERYLFTGARFFVYLLAAIPSILLVALPLAAVGWGVAKIAGVRRVVARWWPIEPTRLALCGIVFAVVAIQFVMRQCFGLTNLLLAANLPADPAWLVALLLDDRLMPLFFSALIIGCAIPLFILVALPSAEGRGSLAILKGLLASLVVMQVLLLPINYGVLIVDKTLPRVAAVGDKTMSGEWGGDEAWLVWEGKDGVTYLMRSSNGRRALVTLARSEVKRTEIVGFDRIVPALAQREKERRRDDVLP